MKIFRINVLFVFFVNNFLCFGNIMPSALDQDYFNEVLVRLLKESRPICWLLKQKQKKHHNIDPNIVTKRTAPHLEILNYLLHNKYYNMFFLFIIPFRKWQLGYLQSSQQPHRHTLFQVFFFSSLRFLQNTTLLARSLTSFTNSINIGPVRRSLAIEFFELLGITTLNDSKTFRSFCESKCSDHVSEI